MAIEARVNNFSPQERSLKDFGIADFTLAQKIKEVLAAPGPQNWKATGLDRKYYLDIMEKIVLKAQDWVDDRGAVIDPIIKKEVGQTTPRFASPGAILLHFGRASGIKDAVFRTMDYCCEQLPSGKAAKNSPDFWMRELATAYMALETVADREHLERWAKGLGDVEPEKIYAKVSPDGKNLDKIFNWVVYSSAGEVMRQTAGLKPEQDFIWGNAFFDKYVGAQFCHMSENGMYRDPGDPFTYDITTRLQIASALAFGYSGKLREPLEEILRRGALTTLLFVSPEGFVPYGGRSASFHFRSAIVAALCELEARRYSKSNPQLAGAFKRQAHLSALSMQRWILEMDPWRHIENGFDPVTRHGIDGYGNYSVYSLLAASFLGLAAIYADDSITEAPCPAEAGGFVLELAPAFHKIFANCGGAYLEIDTAAVEHCDATGLGRFCLKGVPLELGLAMPIPAEGKTNGRGPAFLISAECKRSPQSLAIGPQWEADGKWVSLASCSAGLTHQFKPIKETLETVQFEVSYQSDKVAVVENYSLSAGKLCISTKLTQNGKPAKLRFVVPLLVTDGSSKSQIHEPQDGKVTVEYLGHAFQVNFSLDVKSWIEADGFANRNGVYRSLVLEPVKNEIAVELRLR